MAVQDWIVLTPEKSAQAQAFNTDAAQIAPRLVDASSHPLIGSYVAPARILDDPSYPDAMKAFLAPLPRQLLDSDAIFAPET